MEKKQKKETTTNNNQDCFMHRLDHDKVLLLGFSQADFEEHDAAIEAAGGILQQEPNVDHYMMSPNLQWDEDAPGTVIVGDPLAGHVGMTLAKPNENHEAKLVIIVAGEKKRQGEIAISLKCWHNIIVTESLDQAIVKAQKAIQARVEIKPAQSLLLGDKKIACIGFDDDDECEASGPLKEEGVEAIFLPDADWQTISWHTEKEITTAVVAGEMGETVGLAITAVSMSTHDSTTVVVVNEDGKNCQYARLTETKLIYEPTIEAGINVALQDLLYIVWHDYLMKIVGTNNIFNSESEHSLHQILRQSQPQRVDFRFIREAAFQLCLKKGISLMPSS